jgi:hypothetical protein
VRHHNLCCTQCRIRKANSANPAPVKGSVLNSHEYKIVDGICIFAFLTLVIPSPFESPPSSISNDASTNRRSATLTRPLSSKSAHVLVQSSCANDCPTKLATHKALHSTLRQRIMIVCVSDCLSLWGPRLEACSPTAVDYCSIYCIQDLLVLQ